MADIQYANNSFRGGVFVLMLVSQVFISAIYGQDLVRVEESPVNAPTPSERIYAGGNFGLQFGTFAYVEVAPVMGYWLLPRLAIAAGPTFKYYKDLYGSTDVWGGKGYVRFVFVNDLSNFIPVGWATSLYLHAEYEALNFKTDYLGISNGDPRITISSGLVGAGISQPISSRGSVNFTLLWPVYDSGYKIYNNLEYRVEFNFRF